MPVAIRPSWHPLLLPFVLAILVSPCLASLAWAGPTDAVIVTRPREDQGPAFVPGTRLVENLPQLRGGGVLRRGRGHALQLRERSAPRPHRHGAFTAIVLGLVGIALRTPGVVAGVAIGARCLALELQVRRVEAPHPLAVHDEAYRAYAARTGRFLPGVGRLAERLPGPRSGAP